MSNRCTCAGAHRHRATNSAPTRPLGAADALGGKVGDLHRPATLPCSLGSSAVRDDWAGAALRATSLTYGRAKLHYGLVEVARPVLSDKLLCERPVFLLSAALAAPLVRSEPCVRVFAPRVRSPVSACRRNSACALARAEWRERTHLLTTRTTFASTAGTAWPNAMLAMAPAVYSPMPGIARSSAAVRGSLPCRSLATWRAPLCRNLDLR